MTDITCHATSCIYNSSRETGAVAEPGTCLLEHIELEVVSGCEECDKEGSGYTDCKMFKWHHGKPYASEEKVNKF